jgi:ferric hydroxamate transport system ATP-binding protein
MTAPVLAPAPSRPERTDGATEPAPGALSCRRITAGYRGVPVVQDAGVDIRAGEVTALVGPNGSGKSTLLRTLARLHRQDSGEVCLADGTDADDLSARAFARRVSLLTQQRPTPTGLLVRDVVTFGRHPHRGRWQRPGSAADPEGARAVADAMRLTGVAEMADRAVDELSGGELQRVWLATCLAQDTEVLLLDEPTNHLDLRYQVEVLDLMRDLATQHRVAVGVVLHDLGHAAEIADRVVLLDHGRVVADGAPVDVLTEENLSTAYGIRVRVQVDPVTGAVALHPVGRHSRVA